MVKDPALRQLGEQIATARDAGHSVQIRGGGTRMFYGEPVIGDAPLSVLDMSGWRGIVDYEPSELVLTARAGTPLDEIENLLACHGQMLAFEPPRFGAADTLGGCVATGLSGPRRMAVGGVADFVLGTRLLNAAGEVLRFGGTVMKNVAGYDVSRLLVGSLGVLGVLTEVSLKVMPVPRCEATRVFPLDEAAALQQCLAWRSLPLPISATAWMPEAHGTRGYLWVRLSGSESAVRQGLDRIGGDQRPNTMPPHSGRACATRPTYSSGSARCGGSSCRRGHRHSVWGRHCMNGAAACVGSRGHRMPPPCAPTCTPWAVQPACIAATKRWLVSQPFIRCRPPCCGSSKG